MIAGLDLRINIQRLEALEKLRVRRRKRRKVRFIIDHLDLSGRFFAAIGFLQLDVGRVFDQLRGGQDPAPVDYDA